MSKILLEIFEYSNTPTMARDLLDIFEFVCDKHCDMEVFIHLMEQHFTLWIASADATDTDVRLYARPTEYAKYRFLIGEKIKQCRIHTF